LKSVTDVIIHNRERCHRVVPQVIKLGINKNNRILFAPNLLVSPHRPGAGSLSQEKAKKKKKQDFFKI